MESKSYELLHIPTIIRNRCKDLLETYVLSISDEEITLTSHPHHEDYRPLINLILDNETMPTLWKRLEKDDEVYLFLNSVINDSSSWSMVDRVPKSRQKALYSQTKKQLSKLIQITHESAEVRFATQMFFEEAFNNLLKEERYSSITYKKGARGVGERYFQFSDLIYEIIRTFDNYEEWFMSQKRNEDSAFPRKVNEVSSFRTYMTRNIAKEIERIYSKKNYALVADIINVMFPDLEPLTHEHVHKLLPKRKVPLKN